MAQWPYCHPRWKHLRAKVLDERPTCEVCRHRHSEHVDHIEPVSQGGAPFDRTNLQALCTPCHNRKTRIEQGQRGVLSRVTHTRPAIKGCYPDGMPRDPDHECYKG